MFLKVSRYLTRKKQQRYVMAHHNKIAIQKISSQHIESVTMILTEQFYLREPLCRNLNMEVSKLLPFFREQVTRAAEHGLGFVALDPQGDVLGAATFEDHRYPYVPSERLMTPEFAAIGELMDQLKLPQDLTCEASGTVLYCALAAVKPGHGNGLALSLMLAASSPLMYACGYRAAYAKVTNSRVLTTMRQLESQIGRSIFSVKETKTDADFVPGRFLPLTRFQMSLVTWQL